MPHFRAQMNAVPGMITQFTFVPTITTDSMRTILNDPEFNYVLLCNKVCGSAHYNMQMTIVVEKEAAYEQWLAEQKTFVDNGTQPEAAPEEEKIEEESQVAVN
jgi:cytochrome c oxidase subunit 2